jgi:glutamate/tyrosine decarboxylase-like PLP-dependent enzyme
VPFSVVCFRYRPRNTDPEDLNQLNRKLLEQINASGEFFLSDTVLRGDVVLRAAIGNLRTTSGHVARLWDLLQQQAAELR